MGLKVRVLALLKHFLHISAGKDSECWSLSSTFRCPAVKGIDCSCQGLGKQSCIAQPGAPLHAQALQTLVIMLGIEFGHFRHSCCDFLLFASFKLVAFHFSTLFVFPLKEAPAVTTDSSRGRFSFTIFGTTQFHSHTSPRGTQGNSTEHS